jgi:Trypsin-co-occurring domain 1
MDQAPKPRMVKVVFPRALGVAEPNQTGGIVGTGVSQDTSHSKLGDKAKAALTHVVEEIDADKIAQQTLGLAQRMRPAFDACAEALRRIKVSEISVGCAITAEAGVVFAGVGVETSLEITFDLS